MSLGQEQSVTAEAGNRNNRLLRILVLSAFLTLLLSGNAPAQSPVATEYEVKAAFLYNFARFVEWPPQSFTSASAPFQICVLGENPFGGVLRDLTRDKRVNTHPFEVKDVATTEEARSCHIVFISASEKKRTRQILAELSGSSVLTVGDCDHFVEQGGMIHFLLQGDRVHFAINLKAADQAGLKISSKLLSVANLVAD